MNDINELLKRLLSNGIDFVLVGGFAGVVHGSTQVTRDLDILMVLSESQVDKLRKCLSDLHPRHRMNPGFKPSFIDEPKSLQGVKNLYLETDLGVLDVLTEITGVGAFERIRQHAVEITLEGHQCLVISVEDLVKAKEALGRDKDMIVARELKEILKKNS